MFQEELQKHALRQSAKLGVTEHTSGDGLYVYLSELLQYKSFFHEHSELLSDLPSSGRTRRKKTASSRPPRTKADASKREHKTKSNKPKGERDSGLMQQSERSSAKKQDVDPIPRKEDEAKVSPNIVEKDCHPKDASEQPNPVAAEFKMQLPLKH